MLSYVWRVLAAAKRSVCRVCSMIAEYHRQQERINARWMSYDMQMRWPDTPPQTYAEFLLRTSGPLRREPSARARLHGHPVR